MSDRLSSRPSTPTDGRLITRLCRNRALLAPGRQGKVRVHRFERQYRYAAGRTARVPFVLCMAKHPGSVEEELR